MIKIVFFGTPQFAVESLKALLDAGKEVVAVVTMPDRIGGRGHHIIESDVKKFAVERGLKILQPANLKDEGFLSELKALGADLFIVIAFRMLPKAVWQMPPLGTFNLHASLLPAYRGAAPINRAIMNGEKRTGVTTFFLQHEIDTGDIIDRREVDILDDDNAATLHDKLMAVGAEMTLDTVSAIETGSVRTIPQPEGDFIPAPKIFKEDCRIDWNRPAQQIFNHVRGVSPMPGAWSVWIDDKGDEAEMKIFNLTVSDVPVNGAIPGECRIEKRQLMVASADFFLQLHEIQPSGKKRMDASAFLLGYKPSKFV